MNHAKKSVFIIWISQCDSLGKFFIGNKTPISKVSKEKPTFSFQQIKLSFITVKVISSKIANFTLMKQSFIF